MNKKNYVILLILILSLSLLGCGFPELEMIDSSDITIKLGDEFVEPGILISDPDFDYVVIGSVDTSIVGNYSLEYYTVTENGKKSDSIYRIVRVVDTQAPTYTLKSNITVIKDQFDIEELFEFVADNSDTDIIYSSNFGSIVSESKSDIYTISVTLSDESNNHTVIPVTILYYASVFEAEINTFIPSLTNPNDLFVSTDGYDITYNDLYEEIKKHDGLDQLLKMVDLDLLSSYVNLVTSEEITNKIHKLSYGTDDPNEIANFSVEKIANMDKSFVNSMYLLGYGDNPEDYIKIVVAKELYAAYCLENVANIDESWYANANFISNYYDTSYFEDGQAIKIRFTSKANAKAVLRSLNLLSINGELMLYTGETLLDQVPSSALNETNTRSLTNDELLNKFLVIYNIVYGDYKEQINENSTYADVLANDVFTYDYDSLLSVNENFPPLFYKTLSTYQNSVNDVDEKAFYTYEPVKYFANGNYFYYLIMNLDRTEKVDLSDFDKDESTLLGLIGQSVYDEIRNIANEANLASERFISDRMNDLRNKNNLIIYDYFTGLRYSTANKNYEPNEKGHASLIASYDSKEITADQLLVYALGINAPLYTIYAAQSKAVVHAHFEDIYCSGDEVCEFDVLENTSEKMVEHKAEYKALEEQFNSSYYSSYYTFDEYLYLAYGVKNYEDMLCDYYVRSILQPFFIYDKITSDNYDILNYLMQLSQPYYDNYFSLDVEHLLIYLDRDENGLPDDYDKFYAELEDKVAYDVKLSDFQVAIRTYLNDSDNSLASLENEYGKAKLSDLVWGEFRSYGFYLIFENFGGLTYNDSVRYYEQSFADALIEIYNDYQLPLNSGKTFIYDDEFVQMPYGVHLIKASNNNDFEQPNAQYSMTYDSEGVAEYLIGMVNLTDGLTLEQLKIYADFRFSFITHGTGDLEAIYGLLIPEIPNTVLDSINEYFSDIHDALYVVDYMNSIIANQLLDGTYENSISMYCDIEEAEFNDKLENIIDIYEYQIFAYYDQTK